MEANGRLIFSAALFVLFASVKGYSSTCFVNRTLKNVPSSHVYHWVSRPAIIGYKGNVLSYQENTLEGIEDIISQKYSGVHMQVQATYDDQLIVFGDKNLKRLLGLNVPIRRLKYSDISGLRLKTEIEVSPKLKLKYSKGLKIPLLEDVLNAIRGKGVLIYIELVPSDAPPQGPVERDHALRVGKATAKLVRKMNMINEVFVVSSDPFKLVAVNYYDSAIVTGWWFKKEFYVNDKAKAIRREFVDLPGLLDCYVKTAPTGLEFPPFLYETGIVTKSVSSSVFDASFDVIDNMSYFSGRQLRTIDLLRQNYSPTMHYGSVLTYYDGDAARNKTVDSKKLHKLIKNSMDRMITDDPAWVRKVLTSVDSSAFVIRSDYLVITYSLVALIALYNDM